MKKAVLFILIAMLTFTFSCKKEKSTIEGEQYFHWINFQWEGDTISGRYFDKAAMFVPVKIENVPYTFWFQFDLGARRTMVYGNSFDTIMKLYPELNKKIDTTGNIVINGQKINSLKNITLWLDTVKFFLPEIAFYTGFGDKTSPEVNLEKDTLIMGTIGRNIVENKILIIDYPGRRLAITDSLPARFISAQVEMSVQNGIFKIPINIDGNNYWILFDTGSSLFYLITCKDKWNNLIDTTAQIDTFVINAWGKQETLLNAHARFDFTIAGTTVHPEYITATEKDMFCQFFEKQGVLGIMGNQPFLDKVIFLDLKSNSFGYVKF